MNNENEIRGIVTSTKKRIQEVTKQLKSCPRGTLQNGKYKNKPFLVHNSKVNGKRRRIRIDPTSELCAALVKKYILTDELKQLRSNLRALEHLLQLYKDFDLSASGVKLCECFPSLNQACIHDALIDKESTEWANEPYEQSDFMPEVKVHTTSRGLKVRSKSEALIAEKLYQHNIPFRYEQILRIDNFSFAPDFTIRRADGKIFIWEHEGLTNKKAYLEKQLRKSQIYATQGIVPWDNFIVTYDNTNGDIDLRIVESEIINKLVI